MADRTYRGMTIYRCLWAGDPHGGGWVVQTYHEGGMPWADECCPHYWTLDQAKGAIRERAKQEVA